MAKGSTGISMGGTIEYTRKKKKSKSRKTCKKCIYYKNGCCTGFESWFRPMDGSLALKCKKFLMKKYK